MNYKEAVRELNKNQVASLYLIYGEEVSHARKLEKKIIDAVLTEEEKSTNLVVLEHEPATGELLALVESAPFLGGKNVVVVRETGLFRGPRRQTDGKGEENLQAVEDSGRADSTDTRDDDKARLVRLFSNMPDYSCLIFSLSCKKDAKTKAYKEVNKRQKTFTAIDKHGVVIEVSPVEQWNLREWVTDYLSGQNKKLTADAMNYILSAASYMPQISLGFLENELDKLMLYAGSAAVIDQPVVAEIFSKLPEVSALKIGDHIGEKNIVAALTTLRTELSAGEMPIRLLGLIASHVRRMLQVKMYQESGLRKEEIASQLKLHPFFADKLAKQSRNFSQAVLRNSLCSLAQADSDLKSGKTDSSVLERVLIEMCR